MQKYNITIIPLHIVLGEKEYRDRMEITPDEIYRWSDENRTTPKTSAVSIEDAVTAFAGSRLKLHPRIVVRNGAMEATQKYRGKMSAVIMDYAKDMETDLLTARKNRVFITHSGCSQEIVDQVYSYLKELNYFEEILVTRAGGVISSHCGPGTLGVLYLK